MEPLGLIAGEGVFPILVARGARRAGRTVVCAALAGHARGELQSECDQFTWVGILRLGQWIRVLKSRGCSQAIMVGRVNKIQLYDRWRYLRYIPDWRTAWLFWKIIRRDKRPQAILQALVDELAAAGITLIDSTQYTPEHLVTVGVMTRRQPTDDIGQSIAVVDRDVIAVEALEGTNAMIERAGKLCRSGGWTLIKVSNKNQDMRVDVPTVGTTTIEKLAAAGAGCMVLEPGKTIMLEKPKVLELADRFKIAVVGYEGEATDSATPREAE
jgi:DUF1009 family protein